LLHNMDSTYEEFHRARDVGVVECCDCVMVWKYSFVITLGHVVVVVLDEIFGVVVGALLETESVLVGVILFAASGGWTANT